jgi:hypothetical protein
MVIVRSAIRASTLSLCGGPYLPETSRRSRTRYGLVYKMDLKSLMDTKKLEDEGRKKKEEIIVRRNLRFYSIDS